MTVATCPPTSASVHRRRRTSLGPNHFGTQSPRPTVVVVGGASGLDEVGVDRLRPVFASGIVPVVAEHGAVGVDGGTFSGVMRLLGEARAVLSTGSPLLGVVAAGTVQLPGWRARNDAGAVLEPNHTHFVIVRGDRWGVESPWIAQTSTVLAGSTRSITLLVDGGEIAYADVERSIEAGRRLVAVAASGRTADTLTAGFAGSESDERAQASADSGLVRSGADR